MDDRLSIPLLVMVVGLILKALWDLKNAPNGADRKLVIEVRDALDQRLSRIEEDIRDLRSLRDSVTRLVERDRWRPGGGISEGADS